MVAKPLCPLYKNTIKPLDRARYPELRSSLLIKRAALGNLKASFHCTHWHRFFPLKKAFSKTYPSFLTLKEGSTFLTKPLFPQGREDVTALLGARNRYALRLAGHQSPRQIVRDGTACSRWNSDGQDVPELPSYLASAR